MGNAGSYYRLVHCDPIMDGPKSQHPSEVK